MGTFLLIFNNTVYESADSSGTSWVQEPFPGTVAPNGVLALATTVVVSGWVFDSTAALWSRADQTKFSQLAKGDLSPTLFDFYASRDGPGARVVGNIGAVGGQQSNVQSFDGGSRLGHFRSAIFPSRPGPRWCDSGQTSSN